MVAMLRGQRGTSRSGVKAAPAPRRERKPPFRERHADKRISDAARVGLSPRAALAVAALVIFGGAAAGVLLNRRPPAPAPSSTSLGRALASIGFRVAHVEIEGAPDAAKAAILNGAGLALGQPITDIRLDALRRRIQAVGWVKDAKVLRLLPDTLIVAVTPRQPLAVWQHLGALRVIDGDGQVIGEADPARFPDLPLVVGEGAPEQAHSILPLLRQHPALMARLDAVIRVDGRRWDLRLKDGTLVELPAVGEDAALIGLDQLDRKQKVLSLGLERLDLRDPEVLVVRPRAPAPGARTDKGPGGAARSKG